LTFRYFYLPIISRRNTWDVKLLASFLIFVFVYFWHGQQQSVLIWSIFNFLGVTLEAAGKGMARMPTYNRIEVLHKPGCLH
jgi:D-alanyl-lipoteichoic acid acyltransferase DltB (MBOAT superfamily)